MRARVQRAQFSTVCVPLYPASVRARATVRFSVSVLSRLLGFTRSVCFILFIVCIKKKESFRVHAFPSSPRARAENRDDGLRSVSHFSQEVHVGLQRTSVIVRAK